jgi:hypothetical protein
MCASDKVKQFSEALHQSSIAEKNVKLDRNMAIPDSGRHFAIGTPFKRHPPWHRIGDRVIHVNTAGISF